MACPLAQVLTIPGCPSRVGNVMWDVTDPNLFVVSDNQGLYVYLTSPVSLTGGVPLSPAGLSGLDVCAEGGMQLRDLAVVGHACSAGQHCQGAGLLPRHGAGACVDMISKLSLPPSSCAQEQRTSHSLQARAST